jgi:hypothetical protein
MKNFALHCCLLFSLVSSAQVLTWPESLTDINTDANHTLLIQLAEEITLNGTPVEQEGTLIGVFYNDTNNELQCGGFSEYSYSEGEAISFAAFGDDGTTEDKDGFDVDESFSFYLQIQGVDYLLTATYTIGGALGFTELYQNNGFSLITNFSIEDTQEEIEGCTDAAYLEYNSEATLDDNSCATLIQEGCMDDTALNFSEIANTPCADCCEYPVLGCTDSTAFNYNPNATDDDGSCTDEALGCTNPNYVEYNPLANTDTDPSSCLTDAIFGCTVVIALNYNELANVNDGTCILTIEGCTNDAYLEYNPLATVEDGSCQVVVIEGCTDPDYVEYFPPANFDNGTCSVFASGGCTDINYVEYNPEANNDDGTCLTIVIEGCTDENYLEYNPQANTDDGSCASVSFSGCTDPLADNFNLLANLDDNSCEYLGCTDPQAFNYSAIATTDDGSCEPVVYGCTNPSYLEYNPSANTNDGSCLSIIVYGCTEQIAFNYNVLANVDDGSCIPNLGGCMDTLYVNYNPQATFDDGSCASLIIEGCTDETAINFNNLATLDDGSCTFFFMLVSHENIGGASYEFDVDLLQLSNFGILWSIDGVPFSNQENLIYTFESNGEYLVLVTVSNGFISFVEEILVVVNIPGLNINELEDELIRTDYIDLLGRKVTLPKFGEIYLRTNYFKSGAVTKDKVYFLTK